MSTRTERSEAAWVAEEVSVLTEVVLGMVMPAVESMRGALPPGITPEAIRTLWTRSIPTEFRRMIASGWTPKRGWTTAGAKAAHAPARDDEDEGGTDLTDDQLMLAVWRVIAVEMSDEELAKPEINLTRAGVHAALRSKAPDVAARIGL